MDIMSKIYRLSMFEHVNLKSCSALLLLVEHERFKVRDRYEIGIASGNS